MRRRHILQKAFDNELRQNIEKTDAVDKKIDLNASLCWNFLKKISLDGNNGLNIPCAATSNVSYDLGFWNMEHCLQALPPSSPPTQLCTETGDPIVERSELARLEGARKYTESIILHLGAEEAQLQAEIECLQRCVGTSTIHSEEKIDPVEKENLRSECHYLKENCLKSIDRIKSKDALEVLFVKASRRKTHKQACLLELDKKISQSQSECAMFQISHDILAIEGNALAELVQNLEKITDSVKAYLDISKEAIQRFGSVEHNDNIENSHLSPTSLPLCGIDSGLCEYLIHSLRESHPHLETELRSIKDLNGHVLNLIDEKMTLLKTNKANTSAMDEFSHASSKLLQLLEKASRLLDCTTAAKHDHVSSSSIYWNAMSSLTGVFHKRLIQKIQEVRQWLDRLNSELQKLELSYEINTV